MKNHPYPDRKLVAALALTSLLGHQAAGEEPTALSAEGIGLFQSQSSVGVVNSVGSMEYDDARQRYTISGSGANIWGTEDQFHFVWRRMSGDFIVSADAAFIGEGIDPHRKLGWMIRTNLDTDSAYVDVALHGDGLTSLQYRTLAGGETAEIKFDVKAPDVLQIERRAGTYVVSVARKGETFSAIEFDDVTLPDEIYVGLFISAHNAEVVESARLSNVRITIPAPAGFRPYADYYGSRLEVVDVETGHRRVVHTERDSLQAPNWTVDGKSLIYNRNGRLYSFELATGTVSELPSGFATRNNNDHAISFDGEQLAISHHSEDHDGQSMIYTMPVTGGVPVLVTREAPSYFHGWSPDGDWLVYTGGRDGNYDIYKTRSDGTGEEIRLTEAPELDDGSEYSPDGEYIYFNSARTGRMQIWRMRPDGSEQEQVTDNEFNNWFPHVSPDGETIVYLAYMPDVDASDHPWYKHVYLMVMPAGGGIPKVLANVYGGQGTINVPSWSPDSRHVAFVSNTVFPDN